jgi:3-oxoacyl-[acyl-carrier protein] reductase
VVVVTGGASGIGAATCALAAAEGASVAVLDINAAGAAGVAAGLPGPACSFGLDVADSAAVEHVMDEVAKALGPLDVLIHAAGTDDQAAKEQLGRHAAEGAAPDVTRHMTNERWDRVIAVNLTGPFYCVRAVLRHMMPRRSGSIVLVGSTGGVFGITGYSAYCASKGGVHAFGRSVAMEAIQSGIRVNMIAPGLIDTPMTRRSPAVLARRRGAEPPVGRPDEVAVAAIFLASDEASFIVGETMIVNGGSVTA